MQPMSKFDQQAAKDRKAAVLFQRRREFEKRREQQELQRELREVWQ